jgi:chromosome partitioning protein
MGSRGRVVGFISSKGGVAKTTSAVHFAASAAARGVRVTLLDADPNEGSSAWIAEAAPAVHVERVRTSDQLLRAVPLLAAACDLLVVDGPGNDSDATRSCLLRVDLAVLCSGVSLLDLSALRDAIDALETVRSIRDGDPDAVILPSRFGATRVAADALASMRGMGLPVVSPVPTRAVIADAPGQRRLAWDLDSAAAEPLLITCWELHGHGKTPKRRRRPRP